MKTLMLTSETPSPLPLRPRSSQSHFPEYLHLILVTLTLFYSITTKFFIKKRKSKTTNTKFSIATIYLTQISSLA